MSSSHIQTPECNPFLCVFLHPHLGVEQHLSAHRVQRPGQEHTTLPSPLPHPDPPPTMATPSSRWDLEAPSGVGGHLGFSRMLGNYDHQVGAAISISSHPGCL